MVYQYRKYPKNSAGIPDFRTTSTDDHLAPLARAKGAIPPEAGKLEAIEATKIVPAGEGQLRVLFSLC